MEFHPYVTNILFVTKQVRPDIQKVVAFLITQLRVSDEDYWEKINTLLTYMKTHNISSVDTIV